MSAVSESRARDLLEEAIAARRARIGAAVAVAPLRYYNTFLYDTAAGGSAAARTLYVGVGSGIDALLALLDGLCERAVGVDPFVASEGGNGDEDHHTLLRLTEALGLSERFEVHRARIQDYLAQGGERFDRIVCNQVLHHIYWTRERLTESALMADAVSLFEGIAGVCEPRGRFVVGEASRHGLRPLLSRHRVVRTSVNYRTKQPWREWDAAARRAGWRRERLRNYLPYRLRGYPPLAWGPFGRMTACDTYFLYYAPPAG